MSKAQAVFKGVCFSALVLLLHSTVVWADGPAGDVTTSVGAAAKTDDWTFRLAPYAWVSALSGTTGVGPTSADVYLSMGDVLEKLDGGLMLAFEARQDRFSLLTDLIVAQLSDSSPTPRGVLFEKAKIELGEIIWTQTAGYTVLREDQGALDVFAGFRLMSITTDLKLDSGLLSSRTISMDKTWIDPIIGARGQLNLDEDWFLRMVGDIGGFNASSMFTWQGLAALGYKMSETSSFGLGYRAIGYNHDRDSFKYSATMYGPFLGGEFNF